MGDILHDAHFYALALSIFIPLTLFVLIAYLLRTGRKKREERKKNGSDNS